jgi:hypothetical protein
MWGPIANASLRIMNGYVYLDIRDCKTLHRDCSAIGLRLMQSSTVYMGENHICYIIAFVCVRDAVLCAGLCRFFPHLPGEGL